MRMKDVLAKFYSNHEEPYDIYENYSDYEECMLREGVFSLARDVESGYMKRSQAKEAAFAIAYWLVVKFGWDPLEAGNHIYSCLDVTWMGREAAVDRAIAIECEAIENISFEDLQDLIQGELSYTSCSDTTRRWKSTAALVKLVCDFDVEFPEARKLLKHSWYTRAFFSGDNIETKFDKI